MNKKIYSNYYADSMKLATTRTAAPINCKYLWDSGVYLGDVDVYVSVHTAESNYWQSK